MEVCPAAGDSVHGPGAPGLGRTGARLSARPLIPMLSMPMPSLPTSSRPAVLLVLLTLSLAACGGEPDVSQTEEGGLVLGSEEVTETLTRTVDPAGRTLVLDGFNGSVTLDGTDTDVARLSFVQHARGASAGDAREVLEQIRLEETGDAEAYRFALQVGDAARSRVDVRGEVPRGTAVRVTQERGRVRLRGLTGGARVESGNGPARLTEMAGDVRVLTRNGDVAVGLAQLAPDDRVEVQTSNGDVTLGLPPAAAASVDARTETGEVRVDGLSFQTRRFEPSGAGARFEGRLGRDGGAAVTLRTENGDVLLRTAPLTPAAAPAPLDVPADTAGDSTAVDAPAVVPPDTAAAVR